VLVLAGVCAGLTNGTFAVLQTDLFPTRVRFTGVALVFNVAFTIFSGLSPLLATTLIRETGWSGAPAYLMMASAVIALVGSSARVATAVPRCNELSERAGHTRQ
jgi:MFS family permease